MVTGFAMLTALVTAAGCGVPDSGQPVVVKRIPADGDSGDQPGARVAAPVPRPGGRPEQSIEGFLLATASAPENRHAAARTFVTDRGRQSWNDVGPIRVFRQRGISSIGGAMFRLTGDQIGLIGSDGAFTPSPVAVEFRLRMVHSEGVWRIDNPPPGLLLTDTMVNQAVTPVTLYFPDARLRRLVPDVRYLDASIAASARRTQAVRLLLAGPSPRLAPAVRTAIPAGTSLRGNVVQDGDTARVDLTSRAALAPPATVSAMIGQLAWTVRGTRIESVSFTVEGRRLSAVTGLDAGVESAAVTTYDPNRLPPANSAYRVLDGRTSPLATDQPAPGGVAGMLAGHGQVSTAAVSADGAAAAMVRTQPPGRMTLLLGSTEVGMHAAYSAAELSRPTWGADPARALVAADGQALVSVPMAGPAVRVDTSALAPYLAGSNRIRAVRFGPDGVRLGMLIGTAERSRLVVAAVQAGGATSTLVNPQVISSWFDGATDLAWTGESTVFTVARGQRGRPQPYEVSADGLFTQQRAAAGLREMPTSIAAIPRRSVLVTVNGRVSQLFRSGWASPSGPDEVTASSVFYPG